MRKCPYCLSEIHEATIVCPSCNSDLMVTVPMRVVANQRTREQAHRKSRFVVFVLFGISIAVLSTSLALIMVWLWNFY